METQVPEGQVIPSYEVMSRMLNFVMGPMGMKTKDQLRGTVIQRTDPWKGTMGLFSTCPHICPIRRCPHQRHLLEFSTGEIWRQQCSKLLPFFILRYGTGLFHKSHWTKSLEFNLTTIYPAEVMCTSIGTENILNKHDL